MPEIRYQERLYPVAPGQSVLDALLTAGVEAAHSCKTGVCGACMMQATSGTVPERARYGLKDSWQRQGYFLPCVCLPDSDLTIARADGAATCAASIGAVERLSPDVVRVRLVCDTALESRAGQYVSLVLGGKLARCYSIAGISEERELELHVRRVPGGQMSGWLHDEAQPGDRAEITGPYGDCFYVAGQPEQPLLLAGTGTGLAPLYGVIRDALRQGHTGPIHLFHGAATEGGLYLVNELRQMAETHTNFEYTPAVLQKDGPIENVLLARLPRLSGWRAFVCGGPAAVQVLRKKIFLAGAASRDIYADAFLRR